MKKHILVLSIGLLTAAGVTATVMSSGNNSTKKETTAKETTKKEKKCSRSGEKKKCGLYRMFNS